MAAKAKAKGKAPKELLKRKSGKSGTSYAEMSNRLRLRVEVAETALNGKAPKAKDKGKAPKAKANGKAPKEFLKRKSGKNGTRPKEISNRLHYTFGQRRQRRHSRIAGPSPSRSARGMQNPSP